MSIQAETMTVNLHIGVWAGYRLDKAASHQLTVEAGAEPDAARVNKHLASRETLKPVMTAANTLRTHLFSRTLPWKDNGDRLLPRAMYLTFIAEHGEHVRKFQAHAEHFVRVVYPQVRDAAHFRMGNLFNEDDYPVAGDLAKRFYVNLEIDSVTTADDFRVAIDDAERIKVSLSSVTAERLQAANLEIWDRFQKSLENFAEKLDDGRILRSSTLATVREWVDLVPKLNFMSEPFLNDASRRLAHVLVGVDDRAIRNHDDVRHHVQAGVVQLIDQLKAARLTQLDQINFLL